MRQVASIRDGSTTQRTQSKTAIRPNALTDIFASSATQSQSRSVSISVRMPSELAQKLERACKQNAVGQSELVRDFISIGLAGFENRSNQSSQAQSKEIALENPLNPFEDLAGTWTFGSADDYINELREGWD